MIELSNWLSKKEASAFLKVNEQTLESLREEGYLKPGFHWRSSTDPDQLPWKPIPFYHISLCKEVIQNWKENHVSVQQIAA